MNGTFRHSLVPLFAPCTRVLRTQQLINLKQFTASHPARHIARAAATLQPVRPTPSQTAGPVAEFQALGLSPELLVATQENGLTQPTEIQARLLAFVVAMSHIMFRI